MRANIQAPTAAGEYCGKCESLVLLSGWTQYLEVHFSLVSRPLPPPLLRLCLPLALPHVCLTTVHILCCSHPPSHRRPHYCPRYYLRWTLPISQLPCQVAVSRSAGFLSTFPLSCVSLSAPPSTRPELRRRVESDKCDNISLFGTAYSLTKAFAMFLRSKANLSACSAATSPPMLNFQKYWISSKNWHGKGRLMDGFDSSENLGAETPWCTTSPPISTLGA